MSMNTLVGHAPVAAHLVALAGAGSLPHALLLSGPASVGKTTLALGLAETLIASQHWPGGMAGHPDVWFEDGGDEYIKLSRVRLGGPDAEPVTLQDFLALRAYAGGPRVAIIARAERMTLEAANCILKIVEEPPPLTHIIVCAALPERLPATLVSRCQAFNLGPVSSAEVAAWLADAHSAGPEAASTAASLSGGRPGRALNLATNPGALESELEALDRFLATAGTGPAGAIRAADELAPATGAQGRERSLVQLAVWAQFLRDAICHAAGVPDLVAWTGRTHALERWALLPIWRLSFMLERCLTAADELERNAHPKLCYEVLFLDIFARHPAPPSPDEPALSGGGRPPAQRPRSSVPPG